MNAPYRVSNGILAFLAHALVVAVTAAEEPSENEKTPDWPVVAELSERKLKTDPEDEAAWTDLVKARIKENDLPRAEKALAGWHEKIPHPSPQIDRLQAEAAFAEGDYERSVAAWNHYLAIMPKVSDGWERLASALEMRGDWKDAITALTRCLELKTTAEFYARRASARIRMHDWGAAKPDIEAANKLDATAPEVQSLYPAFERSASWLPAVKDLDGAIARQPKDAHLYLNRAEWLVSAGLQDAAWDDVKAGYKLHPESLRAKVWNGIMETELGTAPETSHFMPLKTDTLTAKFEADLKALDASGNHEARARFLLANHQPFLAVDEVLAIDGSPAKALALLDQGNLPAAGRAARRAVEVHPTDADAWLALARLELENGNVHDALTAVEHSMKLKKTPEAVEFRTAVQRSLGKK